MANDKNFKIKNGLKAGRYLQNAGVDTAGANGPFGVFSTTLYTGTNAALTVNTGLDQNTDGGMLWVKSRSTNSTNHGIWDTERTNGSYLPVNSNDNGGNIAAASGTNPFLRDGSFRWNSGHGWFNQSGEYVAWAFKKQAKFFDVVTYTGNNIAGRTVPHSLGSIPGCMIVKRTDAAGNWMVYHRGIDVDGDGAPETDAIQLESANAAFDNVNIWNDTAPTSSEFTVGSSSVVNDDPGSTYVAYLFAHDTASDSNIKCGSYTGNGSATGPEINLGWEPSWLMVKAASSSGDWWIVDSVRGVVDGGNDPRLLPNTTDVEASSNYVKFTSTGFQPEANFGIVNGSGITYIYIAIRGIVPTQTLDLSTGHTFSFTPSEATDILFSNPPASGSATGFSVEINNSGGYALTWPSSIKWHLGTAPTATASKELYTFVTTDGGTTYYGKLAAGDIA